METRTRKRVRVPDFEYSDDVAERSVKRIKQEKKIKQEIKSEPKIKEEPATNIKIESKIAIKSEIKSEVKIELKKEKIEKVKLEPKIEIKQDPGITEEATDQVEDTDEPIDLNEVLGSANESEKGPEEIEISADDSESNEEEDDEDNEALRIGDCKAKYNFDSFKTIILSKDISLWPRAIEQPEMNVSTSIIEKILSFSELPQVLRWARVSKSMSNLVRMSKLTWQGLFRKQYWRLPHEVRNYNFRPIQQLKIGDKKVDWFQEFKRNYLTCAEVRKTIESVLVVLKSENESPEEGFKLEEESISAWEKKRSHYLSNEMREYFKYSPADLSIPGLEDLYVCSEDVSLSDLYRVKVEEEDDDDEDGEPDLRSLSKLLDIRKSDADGNFAGILYITYLGRQGDYVYVPYVNLMYFITPLSNTEGVYFSQEKTLVETLEAFKQKLKAPRDGRRKF